MAGPDPERLAEPVSAEAPCGPDLEAAGDAEFMNFLANTEGALPASYLSFDPKTIDFETAFATGAELLERTRDVRLFVLLAKLALLERDLAGFAGWIDALRRHLEDHWDEVHPRAEGESYAFRMAPLASLDDLPVVILPLQYAPLVQAARGSPVTFRARMIAAGEVAAREGEMVIDGGGIAAALEAADLAALVAVRDTLKSLKEAVAAIGKITIDKAGYGEAPQLERLPALVGRILAFIEQAVVARDPGEASAPDEDAPHGEAGEATTGSAPAEAPRALGSVKTQAEAQAALAGALDYFARNEPSSPAVLLLGRARQLVGKSLGEVMGLLMPEAAAAARIEVGGGPFAVPLSQSEAAAAAQAGEAEAKSADSRIAALALVEDVIAFYRSAEPSSPIPMLLERVKSLSGRDFTALLRDLLPPKPEPAG